MSSDIDTAKQQTASAAGFHFYSLYNCCSFKAYLRNVKGIDTIGTAPSLIRGLAVHEGIEVFYRTGSVDEAEARAIAIVKSYADEFFTDSEYERVLRVAPAMVTSWCKGYGEQDLYDYDEFLLEQELTVNLNDEFRVTARIDRLARTPDGAWDMFDTKTSTFSDKHTETSFRLSDQPTLYKGIVKRALGIDIRDIYCDIAYFHKKAKNPSPRRSSPIVKTDFEVEQLFESLAAAFKEFNEKTDKVMTGEQKPHEAFPRNTQYCNAYFRECEFAGICKLANRPNDDFPRVVGDVEYVQGQRFKGLGTYTTDSLGEGIG